VPTVDTSDPFFVKEVLTVDECVIVICFSHPEKFGIDNSWMSRRNSIVLKGGKMGMAIEPIPSQTLGLLMDGK
jgi:phosphoribulokinase